MEEIREEFNAKLAVMQKTFEKMLKEQSDMMMKEIKSMSGTFSRKDKEKEAESDSENNGHSKNKGSGSDSFKSSGTVPRYTKLDFATFTGAEDPLVWLRRCDQFFANQNTPEEEKLGVAGYHMLGEAQHWYHHMRELGKLTTWEDLKRLAPVRFGEPLRDYPIGDLVDLKQTSTVEVYQRQFQELLSRVPEVKDEGVHTGLFLAGLAPDIRAELEMLHPTDLNEAMKLARGIERKLQLVQTYSTRKPPWTDQGVAEKESNWADPWGSNIPITTKRSMSNRVHPPPLKRLSQAEIAERRAKGLCFNCDEPFVVGHRCKKLFSIMLEDDGEDELNAQF